MKSAKNNPPVYFLKGRIKRGLITPGVLRAPQSWSVVYVMVAVDKNTSGRACKIGYSGDPGKRWETMYEYLSGMPYAYFDEQNLDFTLRLVAQFHTPEARKAEAACHRRLSDKRVHGEWFDVDPDEAIEVVADAVREIASRWKEVRT